MRNDILLPLFTLGGTLLGVIITSYFNLRQTRINKEFEERRHHKEIVTNLSIENWRLAFEAAKIKGGYIYPLESFMMASAVAAEVIFDPDYERRESRGAAKG